MKLLSKHLIILGICVTATLSATAVQTLDTSAQEKDMRIMQGILESSLKEASDAFPGRPDIKTTYLAGQGYLFTIRLNGLSSIGFPGIASWDEGRLELDIPEIIEEAFSAIESSDSLAPIVEMDTFSAVDSMVGNEMAFNDLSEKAKQYQAELKELREVQRELRRDIFEQSRDVRRAEDENNRSAAEQVLAKSKTMLDEAKAKYDDVLKRYRTERQSKRINRSTTAIDSILQTICDYGQTLKALGKDEKFNLLIRGGVTSEGESADQMYIFSQRDIKGCDNANKLKEKSLYYTL